MLDSVDVTQAQRNTCYSRLDFAWQLGPGVLFCLEKMCSSITHFHLWLSTNKPTDRRISSQIHGSRHM
jgi:hypothetical protein